MTIHTLTLKNLKARVETPEKGTRIVVHSHSKEKHKKWCFLLSIFTFRAEKLRKLRVLLSKG